MRLRKIMVAGLAALTLTGCAAGSSVTETTVTTEAPTTTTAPEAATTAEPEATEAPTTVVEATTEAETTTEAEPDSAYPMTVKDQIGREVEIKAQPERICSGYIISSSTLVALGVQDRIVGIEAKAQKRNIYKLSAPELMELPSIGSAKEPDIEACLALEPDLVILPKKLKDKAPVFEELGIAVLFVNPETQENMEDMVRLLGKVNGVDARAEELLAFTQDQLKKLEDTFAPLDLQAPEVYFAGNQSVLTTAGPAMFQSDMIEAAMGHNVASEIEDTYWAEISYEQLLAWNPEYIILASDAEYSVEDVLSDPNLAGVDAVKNQKVFQMPNKTENWDTPIPSSILGIEWLASVLHDGIVTEEDFKQLADDYYGKFYGFKYSEI